MKHLLLIDTSGEQCTIALTQEATLLDCAVSSEPRNHASAINLMVEGLLHKSGMTFQDLSAISVCAGPGSYTGLRIGLATAKGLCFALEIPLLLDDKLTLLAHQAFIKYGSKHVFYGCLIKAREQEYFFSLFNQNFENVYPSEHITEDKLNAILSDKQNMLLVTSGFDAKQAEKHSKNVYVDENIEIDLKTWSDYAWSQYMCNKTVNLSTSEPFYLKQVYTHK